jgi:hypothetical protein
MVTGTVELELEGVVPRIALVAAEHPPSNMAPAASAAPNEPIHNFLEACIVDLLLPSVIKVPATAQYAWGEISGPAGTHYRLNRRVHNMVRLQTHEFSFCSLFTYLLSP